MKEVIPGVCVFENALKEPTTFINTLESIIDSDISMNWQWAKTSGTENTANIQNSYRTNLEFPFSQHLHNAEIKKLDDLVFKSTTGFVGEYATYFEIGDLTDEGYNILKYEDGTHYKKHHDCGGKHSDRVVSSLLYLNDNYVGGHLEFPYFDFTYYPKAGDFVLFPSNYVYAHIAHPVTEGTKYSLVSWARYGN